MDRFNMQQSGLTKIQTLV